MFVSIDLLGPEEMVLSTAQYLSKYLAEPYNMFRDVCHTRAFEKNWSNDLFSLEFLTFLKTLCFHLPLSS